MNRSVVTLVGRYNTILPCKVSHNNLSESFLGTYDELLINK